MKALRRGIGVLSGLALLAALGASVAGASGVVPPKEPVKNLPAIPVFNTTSGAMYTVGAPLPPCWHWDGNQLAPNPSTKACVTAEIQATNRAHRLERIPALTLPRNFAHLTANEQSLVMVDLERVSRGEAPVLGLSAAADTMAQRGAQLNADPVLTNAHAIAGATGGWTANWAAAVNILDANYSWMYDDGWAGKGYTFNYECTSASARGCWGHRNDILVNASNLPCYAKSCSLVMGAGVVAHNWDRTFNSYSQLIVQVSGTVPPLIYTWKQAVAAGARA